MYGSLERFLGVLIEHLSGAFPLWIAPVQAVVVPIADRHNEFCHEIGNKLRTAGLRIEVDDSNERMNAKIRQAQLQKVPYMLVVGDRELAGGIVSVRTRTGENLSEKPVENVVSMLVKQVLDKA
jgi:threonyl-tRNA synthetase